MLFCRLNFFLRLSGLFGWLLITLLAIQSAYATGSAPERNRMSIAVAEFAVRGTGLSPQAGAIIADSLTSTIANLNQFNLKDRISLLTAQKFASKNELGSTGPIDPETAIELGKYYRVEGVVTGTVSKLGSVIRVTARLIDTKTGVVLRSGEIQGNTIDWVQINLNALALSITGISNNLKDPGYSLKVKTTPPDANINFLNPVRPYQLGVHLLPGNYQIEVHRSGYKTQHIEVPILDHDVSVLVTLEKISYTLSFELDPPNSQVKFINELKSKPYYSGMRLESGTYLVEISSPGYKTKQQSITILDNDLTMSIKLEKTGYRMMIKPEPNNAKIKILNSEILYNPDIILTPDEYQIEINAPGFESKKITVLLKDSDLLIPVNLVKKSITTTNNRKNSKYHLTVLVEPPQAQVEIMNIKPPYQPGIELELGNYDIRVRLSGYKTARFPVHIIDDDVTVRINLEQEKKNVLRFQARSKFHASSKARQPKSTKDELTLKKLENIRKAIKSLDNSLIN